MLRKERTEFTHNFFILAVRRGLRITIFHFFSQCFNSDPDSVNPYPKHRILFATNALFTCWSTRSLEPSREKFHFFKLEVIFIFIFLLGSGSSKPNKCAELRTWRMTLAKNVKMSHQVFLISFFTSTKVFTLPLLQVQDAHFCTVEEMVTLGEEGGWGGGEGCTFWFS